MADKKSDNALDALFWRDEILQVMFWMYGEGLGEWVGVEDLQVFLDSNAKTIHFYLEQAVTDGYLIRHPDPAGMPDGTRYSLSDIGRQEGGRRFRDEFEGMQKSSHGECRADCTCHSTGNRDNCPSHRHDH